MQHVDLSTTQNLKQTGKPKQRRHNEAPDRIAAYLKWFHHSLLFLFTNLTCATWLAHRQRHHNKSPNATGPTTIFWFDPALKSKRGRLAVLLPAPVRVANVKLETADSAVLQGGKWYHGFCCQNPALIESFFYFRMQL